MPVTTDGLVPAPMMAAHGPGWSMRLSGFGRHSTAGWCMRLGAQSQPAVILLVAFFLQGHPVATLSNQSPPHASPFTRAGRSTNPASGALELWAFA